MVLFFHGNCRIVPQQQQQRRRRESEEAEPVRALPAVRQDAFDGGAGGRREGAPGARRRPRGRQVLQLRRPAGGHCGQHGGKLTVQLK